MLEAVYARLLKTDLEYLREISKDKGRGALTWHIRNAVSKYVKELKKED